MPVGRGSVQSLKKYSPALSNVYLKLCPGFSLGLNRPSKNWVAQCSFWLGKFGKLSAPGFRNVTVVPTGTRMLVGNMAFVSTESRAAAVSAVREVRARRTVLFTVLPSTGWPPTARRTVTNWGAGASLLPDSVL